MAAYRFMVAPLFLSALIFICLLDKSACREATAPGPFALSIFIPPESSKTIRQWLKKGKQHSACALIEKELYFLQSIGLSARRIVVSGLNLLLFSNLNYLFRRALHLLHLSLYVTFLVACSRLYNPLCPSCRWSVSWSVGWLVVPLFFRRF